ncbi:hypothetical protein ACIA8L_34405, partial [Dactylosporangium sp. NPDC051541]
PAAAALATREARTAAAPTTHEAPTAAVPTAAGEAATLPSPPAPRKPPGLLEPKTCRADVKTNRRSVRNRSQAKTSRSQPKTVILHLSPQAPTKRYHRIMTTTDPPVHSRTVTNKP